MQENYNKLLLLLNENINFLHSFSEIYLFGSFLTIDYPDDIDLLFIYYEYSQILLNNVNNVSSQIERILKIPVDSTILNTNELKGVRFLDRLNNNYRLIWKYPDIIF